MKLVRRALLFLCLLIPSLTHAEPEWELLRVNGSSMEPTVHHGDNVCLHRGVTKLHVGDLVAIRLSNDKPPLLKRVVAVAGDKVVFIGNRLIRNGAAVSELLETTALKVQLARYGNTVPSNNLIALGDNGEQSFDSSEFGLIDYSQVVGAINIDTSNCISNE